MPLVPPFSCRGRVQWRCRRPAAAGGEAAGGAASGAAASSRSTGTSPACSASGPAASASTPPPLSAAAAPSVVAAALGADGGGRAAAPLSPAHASSLPPDSGLLSEVVWCGREGEMGGGEPAPKGSNSCRTLVAEAGGDEPAEQNEKSSLCTTEEIAGVRQAPRSASVTRALQTYSTTIARTKTCSPDLPLMLLRRRKSEGAGRALDLPCASLAPAAALLAAVGGNARPPAGRLLGCTGCSAAAGAACTGTAAGWAAAGSALLGDWSMAGLGARGGGLGAWSTCSTGWLNAAVGDSPAGAVSAAAAAGGAASAGGAPT